MALTGAAARTRLIIQGVVQGVGFRPYLQRRATALGLAGRAANTAQGVTVEVEGPPEAVEAFAAGLAAGAPAAARVEGIARTSLAARGARGFTIGVSRAARTGRTTVPPDLATCPACLAELFDPADRRHRYPFINCTDCGPRYSIIEALPYDRTRTAMRAFAMCAACGAEYREPADRRFHAEPNACPACGPRLALRDPRGRVLARDQAALAGAARALRAGRTVALKGLGGYQLLVDARNGAAVARLRRAKGRPEKPLAVMWPDIAGLEACARVSAAERDLLRAPEAPIVLLRRRADPGPGAPAGAVAPGHPWLGALLPYTPLHHLLLGDLGFAVVATSGNRAEEPIAADDDEALERLGGIAGVFLTHDRPIVHAVDDSVVRVVDGAELVLRRARGYAALPVGEVPGAHTLLALGGHLKNAPALCIGGRAYLGPHVGDLDTVGARSRHARTAAALCDLYGAAPEGVVCDLHPDYATREQAGRLGLAVRRVQHHVAHVAACLAENGIAGPALGVAWDGSGYGPDGTVWGGELLELSGDRFRRAAHLRTFPLPGGEAAVREPRRAALGVLFEVFGPPALEMDHLAPVRAFTHAERRVLGRMLARGVNAPRTSSAGRLFDAVAALLGLVQRCTYEGQAAGLLEGRAEAAGAPWSFEIPIREGAGPEDPLILDWGPLVEALASEPPESAAAASGFHDALAEAVVAAARRVGEPVVALTGGCFQNRTLTERTLARLRAGGFQPCRHRRVPPNDGGLALGQLAWAARTRDGV